MRGAQVPGIASGTIFQRNIQNGTILFEGVRRFTVGGHRRRGPTRPDGPTFIFFVGPADMSLDIFFERDMLD